MMCPVSSSSLSPSSIAKRSAEDVPHLVPDSKRRSLDESSSPEKTPELTKEDAATVVKSLELPKVPKKQSEYVRFKSLLLQHAKATGDTDTSQNITIVAKNAWAMVKDVHMNHIALKTIDSNTGQDNNNNKRNQYLALKKQVMEEISAATSEYRAKLAKFKEDFLHAAIAHVKYQTIEANVSNSKEFEAEINMVHSKATQACTTGEIPLAYTQVHQEAKSKLAFLQKEWAIQNLVQTLRTGSDEDLVQHAKQHLQALEQVEEFQALKQNMAQLEAAQKEEEEKQLQSAYKIKTEVCNALKKQMVYTNSSLKHCSKSISYQRNGVTPAVFAAAFGVSNGTTRTTIRGSEVGTKSLRYYSYLVCSTVTVKLMGDTLMASASYMLEK